MYCIYSEINRANMPWLQIRCGQRYSKMYRLKTHGTHIFREKIVQYDTIGSKQKKSVSKKPNKYFFGTDEAIQMVSSCPDTISRYKNQNLKPKNHQMIKESGSADPNLWLMDPDPDSAFSSMIF
jgi:hypothetical protein